MKVLFASAEAAPFFKSGGLGDVAYALPKENLMDSVYLNYGVMTNTPINPKRWLYEENVALYDHNPSMASTFLKNSGWADADGNGKLEKKGDDGQTKQLKATILVNQKIQQEDRLLLN